MQDPWIVKTGYWLTKRRSIMFAPLFTVTLLAAHCAGSLARETAQDLLGILCLAGGTWLRLVAASYHESSHQRQPISAGPYAWIRHPLYVSNFLLGLGIVLVAGWRPMLWTYLIVFLPIHWLIARAEEIHLATIYGSSYDVYRRAVPAVLPWRPLPAAERYGRSGRVKLRKGQEWLKVAGYALGVAAILVIKALRQYGTWPVIPPIPPPVTAAAFVIALLSIVMRPKLHLAWISAGQTVLAVAAILVVVIHVPGVWPAPQPPHTTQHS